MVSNDEVYALASIAKISLTEIEAEDVRKYIEEAISRADADADEMVIGRVGGDGSGGSGDGSCGNGGADGADIANSADGADMLRICDADGVDGGGDASLGGGANGIEAFAAMTIDDLRPDVPVRETRYDEIFMQSPSEGADGFAIKRLIE